MQILNAANPAGNLPWLLISLIDRVDVDGSGARHIFALHVLELKHGLILVVQAGLIEHADAQFFLRTVGLWHLEERVDLADSWDVIRNEWLQLSLQVNLLRLVTLDVLEHLLKFLRNRQVRVLVRVIGTWDLLLILIVVIVVVLLLSLLRHLLLRRLRFLGWSLLVVHVDIDFVFFLIRVDFFAVVDIDGEVERLVLHFVALHVRCLGLARRVLRLVRLRDVSFHGLTHCIVGSGWHRVSLLLAVEVFVANLERFASLLRELLAFV